MGGPPFRRPRPLLSHAAGNTPPPPPGSPVSRPVGVTPLIIILLLITCLSTPAPWQLLSCQHPTRQPTTPARPNTRHSSSLPVCRHLFLPLLTAPPLPPYCPPHSSPSSSLDPFRSHCSSRALPLTPLLTTCACVHSFIHSPTCARLHACWLCHTLVCQSVPRRAWR